MSIGVLMGNFDSKLKFVIKTLHVSYFISQVELTFSNSINSGWEKVE